MFFHYRSRVGECHLEMCRTQKRSIRELQKFYAHLDMKVIEGESNANVNYAWC